MSHFDVEVTGLDQLKEKLSQLLEERIPRAVSSEIYVIAEEVMAASKELVPVDTGTLMNTGHVQLPEQEPDGISVTLGYGGPAAPYALKVHEDLDPHIHWHRPGSGPKYLEIPMKAKESEISGRIASAVHDELNK